MSEAAPGIVGGDVGGRVAWRTSSRSSDAGGNCVEVGPVRDGSGRVAVRHSRHRDGATFVYSRARWDAFLARAKNGDFDIDTTG